MDSRSQERCKCGTQFGTQKVQNVQLKQVGQLFVRQVGHQRTLGAVAGSVAYLVAGTRNLVGHSPATVRHIQSVLHVERVGNSILVLEDAGKILLQPAQKGSLDKSHLSRNNSPRPLSITDIQCSDVLPLRMELYNARHVDCIDISHGGAIS